MIHLGMVSVTFRQLSPEEIVELVVKAGLDAIEWGGDIHVPHGDTKKARYVHKITADAGLLTPVYGSYYQVNESEKKGLTFNSVLDSALSLGAPIIRVWAGVKDSGQADEDYWNRVVSESQRIADIAAASDITLTYEFHCGSLVDTVDSAKKMIQDVGRENMRLHWQPIVGTEADTNIAGLEELLPYIEYIHVFHWWPTHTERHPLADGAEDWTRYLTKITSVNDNFFAMLEFVQDDLPENFLRDAVVLKVILNNLSPTKQ